MEPFLRYYENDVSVFLSYVDENVLWYGPADEQVLRGKAAMFTAWAAEEDQPLTITVGDLKAEMVPPRRPSARRCLTIPSPRTTRTGTTYR